MIFGPHFRAELWRVALLVAASGLGGVLLGRPFAVMVIALLGYLIITLLQLAQLERRLSGGWQRPEHEMPAGLWRAIDEHLYDGWRRDRVRRHEAVRQMRAFREATAAMPDAVLACDPHWAIEWANPAATRLLGIQMPRDAGQPVVNLVRSPAVARALAARSREPVEVESPRDPGRWLTMTLVEFGEGRHLLFARDTTRLRRLETMRREFVANASHELRSPLTVIAGYLEAMHDDPAIADGWGGPLGEMQRQTRRMTGIVEDLLELSRLETEGEEPARDPIDVPGLLARIREEALALGEGPREVAVDCAGHDRLLGVEKEIHSAISNLVFNAMRYTPANGRVAIRWRREGAEGIVEVIDTGIGIAAEHLPRLTERFYRVDTGRSRAKGGTGLGLAIVKHVVQRHGAQLRVDSTPGVGSTFAIRFPAGRWTPVTDR